MTPLAERFYCPTGSPQDRLCRAFPCHGHRATRDQVLVAKVIAYTEGVDWFAIYQSERRERLRKAHTLLRAIRRGDWPSETSA